MAGSVFGYARSTYDVAAAVAEQLITPGFLADLPTPVAELPIHLLGHSRGASLVGELAHQLGQRGVWVDQVSTWDPHPVDGIREPTLFNADYGDAPMVRYQNVVFWDNYWRTQGDGSLDFTGEPVANTANLQLSEAVLSDGGYSNEHSDVHLWYHGTVDPSLLPPANDGSEDVPQDWYGGPHPQRGASGFVYSRIVGGARPLTGLSQAVGGTAESAALDWSGANWPNLLDLRVIGGGQTFDAEQTIPLSYYHADADSGATVSLSLDVDQNPYNDNPLPVAEQVVSSSIELRPNQTLLPTSGIAAGSYYISARIADAAGRTRYAYSSLPITLVATTPEEDDYVDISDGQSLDVTAAAILEQHPQSKRLYVYRGAAGQLNTFEPWQTAEPQFIGGRLYHRGDAEAGSQTAKLFVSTDNAWSNPFRVADVDGNGLVEPIDVLYLINALNRARVSSFAVVQPLTDSQAPERYLDVDNDRLITPSDPLQVVNWLNIQNRLRRGNAQA
ncbi:hypothetical protein UC8_07820 [Roseimaritima ulvae]|uniref:Dockerin domain-containing protein n=1 Tax=Roseimaritima ulvae TaxID=980254 RepID=A0A5B9QIU3_9BACT|nr:hypothetical protein UC8_07820 [Roseimaritima ulvae]